MRRLLGAGLFGAAVLGAASCTSTPAESLSAGGCTPTRSIYQPGIGGAPGTIINLPGNCPSAAELKRAQAILAEQAATTPAPDARPDTRPVPPPLPDARAAVANGVERLCAWFLKGEGYSLPALQQAAFDAGYRRGASVYVVPPAEALQDAAMTTFGFQAVIKDAPPEGSGVVAFAGFDPNFCQVQVYSYADAARAYIADLPQSGWRQVGGSVRVSENVTAERFFGGASDNRMTLIVNRWTGRGAAPANLNFIINLVPGEVREGWVLR